MNKVLHALWRRFRLLSLLFVIELAARVFAIGAPSITTQPQSQRVLVNSNATLSVVGSGQSLRYQWFLNGTNALTNSASISGATNSNLTVSTVMNLAPSPGSPVILGPYSVVVSNTHGKATSSNAFLTVLFPPGIAIPQSNVAAILNTDVTISASVSGTAPLAYQWYFNGAALTNNGQITGAATTNLNLASVQTNASGLYRLVATNKYGAVTSGIVTLKAGLVLPGLTGAVSAWADYDDDGQPDVLLAGTDGNGSRFTRLYHNIGSSLFLEANVSLPQLDSASAAWGDFNNDGNLDFVLTGEQPDPVYGLIALTLVYTNDAHGGFVETGANIEGQSAATVNAVDFDNDGRLDIFLSRFGHFWRNVGNGKFEISPFQTGGAYPGLSAWGDFNNDGTEDLLLAEPLNANSESPTVWRNGGEAGFGMQFLDGIGPPYSFSYAWGDYDNDGFLDVLVPDYYGLRPLQVYHNDGNGGFTATNLSSASFQPLMAKWGDFNNDGKLDALEVAQFPGTQFLEVLESSGSNYTPVIISPGIFQASADWVDINKDGNLDVFYTYPYGSGFITNTPAISNTPPTTPAGLSAILLTNSGVMLQWTPSTDGQTPSPGLNYNLRVGTTPGGVEVMSPASDLATGRRQILARGNAGQAGFWTLCSLPSGTYYWSVQAIDTSFAGSPFSAEGSFTITNTRPNISTIPNQVTGAAVSTPSIPFIVSDDETPADNLQLVGYSSNTNLVPLSGIVFGGSGSNRTVTVSPAPELSGTVTIGVQVLDLQGDDRSTAFVLTVTNFPAVITVPPTNQTVIAGSNTSFQVTATGTALSYHWFLNGTMIANDSRRSGATGDSLVISNVLASDAGFYTVVVSNAVNSVTNSGATLTVIVPPSITTQPKGRSAPIGLPAFFSAFASGTAPLAFQWNLNGLPIPSATNVNYTNLFLTINDFGSYQLVVTNSGGAVTSAVALLTRGPVAIWGGGSFTGAALSPPFPPPGLSNVVAIAGSSSFLLALKSDGTITAWGSTSGTNVPAGLTNAVAITAGSTFGAAVRSDGTVVAWGSGGGTNVTGSISNVVLASGSISHALGLRSEHTLVEWGGAPQGKTPIPIGLAKIVSMSDGRGFGVAARSDGTVATWGSMSDANLVSPAPPIVLSNVVSVAAGSSHALALRSDGSVFLWSSPSARLTNTPASLTNIMAIAAGSSQDFSSPYSLALRSNGVVVGWGLNTSGVTNIPPGLSNVVAIAAAPSYAMALVSDGSPIILQEPVGGTAFSGNQFNLTAQVSGQSPLTYSWSFNGTNLPDATNSSFTIANAQLTDAGIYQLTVSNALGIAASVPVPVTVIDGAPSLLAFPPATNRPYIGSQFRLDAAPVGSGPLQLQWQLNGQNLPGETNASLAFPRLYRTNSGNYTLIASNGFGSITSSVALLAPMSVVGWGTSIYGATNPPLNLSDAIAIALNTESAAAIRANGTVATWGISGTNVPANVTNIVEIANSQLAAFALRANGTVRGWNSVSAGLSNAIASLPNIVSLEADTVGNTFLNWDGTVTRISTAGVISPFPQLTNVVTLTRYYNGFAALRADGTVFTSTGTAPPSPPIYATTNVFDIALDNYWGGALKRDRTIRNWNVFAGPTNLSNMIAVSENAGVRSDGTVAAWTSTPNSPSLTNLPVGLGSVAAVEGFSTATLALLVPRDFQPLLLPDALDTTALVVSSRGAAKWFTETNVTHDGIHAVQSAALGNNTASSMRMWIAGPVMVSFWWKVSSETNHDFLSFYAGGVLLTNISGETGWQQCTVATPPGNQILQWTYSKDASGNAGQDSGWVDQLVISPIAPSILIQPASTNALGGANVILNVSAVGTPPLAYQWSKDSNVLAGMTAPSLALLSVTRTNSGTYSVVVTNIAGSVTSSNATLQVRTPQLLSAPALQPDGTIILNSSDADGGTLASSDLANFQVQVSSNLVDWVPLPGALILTNGALQLQDLTSTNTPTHFYRIVESW